LSDALPSVPPAVIQRLDALAVQRRSFAFESTLASQSLAGRIDVLKSDGYTVHVLYLWLPDIELATARAAERVRAGGHNIPAEAVRRRCERGRQHFFTLYRGLSDRWRAYDALSVDGPDLVATGGREVPTRIHLRTHGGQPQKGTANE
jgi:predicted ABC-type ATPase